MGVEAGGAGAVMRRMVEGVQFPESLRWRAGELWFVDMRSRRLLSQDGSGRVREVSRFEHTPSGLGFLRDGSPIVALLFERVIVRVRADGLVERYSDLTSIGGRLVNDLVVHPDGAAYVGIRGVDVPAPGVREDAIARVEPSGRFDVVAGGDLDGPNGMCLTPDGEWLVVAETGARRLSRYLIGRDGMLGDRQTWADLDGVAPDGITMDASGRVWVAAPFTHEVLLVGPRGVERRIRPIDGGQPLSCTLGGESGRALYFSSVVPDQPGALTTWLLESADKAAATPASIFAVEVEVPGSGSP